jgi:peroxiredoxin
VLVVEDTGSKGDQAQRSTLLIDAEGRVAEVMRRSKPDTHVELVLAELPLGLVSIL